MKSYVTRVDFEMKKLIGDIRDIMGKKGLRISEPQATGMIAKYTRKNFINLEDILVKRKRKRPKSVTLDFEFKV